jgi:hypothetical protein
MSQTHAKKLVLIGFLVGLITVAAFGATTFPDEETGTVSDGVTFGAPDGMNVTITGSTDVKMESLFPSSDTVDLTTESGNVTFSSSGTAFAEIHKDDITGTYTKVTSIDAVNDITINPENKRSITVGKDIDSIQFRDAGIDNGQTDFIYAGSSGESKVVVGGLQANTQIGAIDVNSDTLLEITTTDGSGVATFDSLSNSQHTVQLQTSSGGPTFANPDPSGDTERLENVDLSVDVDDPDFNADELTLEWYVDGTKQTTTTATSAGTETVTVGPFADGSHSWYVVATDQYGQSTTLSTQSFTIDHYDPEFSNLSPTGDLNSKPSTIDFDVNDADFGGVDGDSITVTTDLDGTQIDQQTINSNASLSVSIPSSGLTGGQHTYELTATDDYGQTVTTQASYTVPETFFVRNERNHSELIAADGSITFFTEDQVFERSASDGKINMTGLPVNEEFIVEVDPTDGNFTQRTIFIPNIYQQESAYVLNTSAVNTVDSRFILNDPTGNYDSQTLLQIKRPINVTGSTSYQTIVADEFGTEGVTATLEQNIRYELRVMSDSDAQSVGPYRADTSETVEVEPGAPNVNLSTNERGWAANAYLDNRTLEWAYADADSETDELTVYIHERGNPSNLLRPNKTYYDLGTASEVVSLTANESEKEWAVKFVVDRNGNDYTKRVLVSNQRDLTPDDLANGWQLIIGVGSLLMLAGAFSVLNASIGAIVVSVVGGVMFFIGFLPGATSALAVVIALFVSVVGHVYTRN